MDKNALKNKVFTVSRDLMNEIERQAKIGLLTKKAKKILEGIEEIIDGISKDVEKLKKDMMPKESKKKK